MVVQTGSVYVEVTGGLVVTGVTGPAPRTQRAAGGAWLGVVESVSQIFWIRHVGMTGPAAVLSLTQIGYRSTPLWSLDCPATSLMLLQPQRPPLAGFSATTYRQRENQSGPDYDTEQGICSFLVVNITLQSTLK